MKNWTIKEAVEVIKAGNDQAAIKEIAKHFPMFFLAVATNDIVALTAAMNDKFTVRRLMFDDVVTEDAEDAEDTDAVDAAEDTTEDAGDVDLSKMSTKELMKLCDKRGIKVPHYGKNKQFYLDALQGASGDGEGNTEDNAEDNDDAESGDEYEGKSAMELYKLCKKRGLKVEPKKKAAVYADALRKADAEAEAADAGNDDADGWDDDAEDGASEEKQEKKAPAKGGKSASTKKSDKPAPAKAEEEDDGDDWDI